MTGAGESLAGEPPTPAHLARYRPNVGIVLSRADARVWLGRRSDVAGPFNWQFPQGGVDPGEDLQSAALRELKEETGAVSARVLGRTPEWLAYEFPPHHRRRGEDWVGQRQIWFALRFTGDDEEFDLRAHSEPEFDAWVWADLDSVVDQVVPFKRPTYQAVIDVLRPLILDAGALAG